MMRWSCWLFLCLLVTGLITTVSDDHALAKSYTFPLVEIASQVNPDGSLWITERRTYEFSGAFSWATYTLERRGWTGIADVTVADGQKRYRRASSGEPGTFQVSMTPAQMEVKWHFRAEDQRKTFTIRYGRWGPRLATGTPQSCTGVLSGPAGRLQLTTS